MNKLFTFFAFLFAVAVSALHVPVVFNKSLLEGHDKRFVAVHHGSFGFDAVKKLRFLLLFPKLGAELGAFATEGKGLHPKTLNFVHLDTSEVLTDFFALSDCKTWHAGLVTVWGPGGLVHKGFTGELGEGFVSAVASFDEAAAFVVPKVLKHHFFQFVKGSALPSHVFTHKLHVLFDAKVGTVV